MSTCTRLIISAASTSESDSKKRVTADESSAARLCTITKRRARRVGGTIDHAYWAESDGGRRRKCMISMHKFQIYRDVRVHVLLLCMSDCYYA